MDYFLSALSAVLKFLMNYFPSFLSTLFAAFIGAYFAFKFNIKKEQRKEEERKQLAINFALFTLTRQLNTITLVKQELDRYSENIDMIINLPALQVAEQKDFKQNFSDLAFILDLSDPNILMELSVEQERFEQAMTSVKLRNEYYLKECIPRLSQAGLNHTDVTGQEVKEVLGELVYEACLHNVEQMREYVTKGCESIPLAHEKLYKLAEKQFPKRTFIKQMASETR